jgi:hypothetical protein
MVCPRVPGEGIWDKLLSAAKRKAQKAQAKIDADMNDQLWREYSNEKNMQKQQIKSAKEKDAAARKQRKLEKAAASQAIKTAKIEAQAAAKAAKTAARSAAAQAMKTAKIEAKAAAKEAKAAKAAEKLSVKSKKNKQVVKKPAGKKMNKNDDMHENYEHESQPVTQMTWNALDAKIESAPKLRRMAQFKLGSEDNGFDEPLADVVVRANCQLIFGSLDDDPIVKGVKVSPCCVIN